MTTQSNRPPLSGPRPAGSGSPGFRPGGGRSGPGGGRSGPGGGRSGPGGGRSGPGGGRSGPGGVRSGRPRYYSRRKICGFCVDHIEYIDYKDIERFRRYVTDRWKIESRRKTGVCSKHQRALANAIKRARHLALIPFSPDHDGPPMRWPRESTPSYRGGGRDGSSSYRGGGRDGSSSYRGGGREGGGGRYR